MKKRTSSILKKSLLSLGVTAIIIKIGFEIDNHYYMEKLESMTNELKINIEGSIKHQTLELDGYQIHYYISGIQNKSTIVFLHPAFSDHSAFDQQIDFFSESYRVITIDLIGHGLSKANKSKDQIDASAEHISKILELENIGQAHIVGVSMGSLIAQHFAIQYPDKLKSLSALGGYNINKTNNAIEKIQRRSNLGLLCRAIFSMDAFRKKAALTTCISEKGQTIFYKTTSHYERKSFLVMRGLKRIITFSNNTYINLPTLIMVGEFDVPVALKMSKEWFLDLENSEYHLFQNAGHCANMDAPLAFNKRVKEFIDKNNE